MEIKFNNIFMLKSKDNKFYAVEKVIKGLLVDFSCLKKEKFQIELEFNEVAQAFSHYTFQKSDGNILICVKGLSTF